MANIRPRGERRNVFTLLAVLAAVCLAIYAACAASSVAWVGKPFSGFLLMDNRVVAAAGLPHWPGLQAARLFYAELVTADGGEIRSAASLRRFLQGCEPGRKVAYRFRRGEESISVTLPVLRFLAGDFLGLFGFYLFNGLAFLLTGLVVFAIRPNRRASNAMLAVGVCAGLWATTACDLYGPHRFFRLHVLMECLMPAAILHMALVFPEERRWVRRRPSLLAAPYLAALGLALPYEWQLFDPALYVWNHNLATLYLGLALIFYLTSVTLSHFHTRDLLARQRTRVLFLGSFLGLLMPALILVAATLLKQKVSFTQISFFTFLWPVTIGFAILKHDLFDIDTFVKRSIYYFTLTGTVLCAYLAVFALLGRCFQDTAVSSSPYLPILFFLLVLLVFNPLRQRLQILVDRVYFRIRVDYRETVEEVSRALTSLLNLEEIVRSLLATATDTMMIQRGILTLRGPRGQGWVLHLREGAGHETRPAGFLDRHPGIVEELECRPGILTRYDLEDEAAPGALRADLLPAMQELDLFVVLPVLFRSRFIGLLGLGRKKSGQYYTRADLELLQTLANQGAVALSNAASYRELEALNQNLEGLVQERTRELAETNRKLEVSYGRLQELDQLKSQFFANVGHELRTPLTLSLAPLESLLQGEVGSLDPEQKGLLATIHRNALKLLNLVNNLLDFSKIEAGRLRLDVGRVRLLPFVRQIVEPFEVAGRRKGIGVEFSAAGLRDPELVLYLDAERMEKVFANLLSNAFKYTPPGGRIRVRLEEEDGRAGVEVADTGPGIPEEELPRIFERFHQVVSKEGRRVAGTGIGLSLVKEFSELHGGEVAVSSEPGRGSAFTVLLRKGRDHLPADWVRESPDGGEVQVVDSGNQLDLAALEAPEQTGPAVDGAAEAAAGKDAPRVLVVEDNPEMRAFLRTLLRKDYRVIEARDGLEGLESCRAERPDLVLSDVSMPRMTGFELCRQVKQDPDLRFIPFVLITSRAEVEFRIEGFEAGADEYVGKPFNPRELQARVRSLLNLRRAERELNRTHLELRQAHEELKAAEAQLIHSEKMVSLGRLVAGVAHELNNPISFVYGNINVLQDYVRSMQQILQAFHRVCRQGEYGEELERLWEENDLDMVLGDIDSVIEGCREGALRTKQIVADLRTFSRLDEAERKQVDLHEGIRTTLNLLRDQRGERVRVHLELDERLPEVECNARQINQALMNLLANATQAIAGEGDIWVRTRLLPPDRLEIEVEDTGQGIAPDVLPKIFDPFFTTKPVGSGTGLGLSITYGIIHRHGGSISVRSEPGSGTCFTVVLPLTPPAQGEPHDRQPADPPGERAA